MLPISLNTDIKVGLAGHGDSLGRRAALLFEAGISPALLADDASDAEFRGLRLVFLAGLDREKSRALAARARAAGVLVNVEDMPELCDFHVPAIMRRGDLVLTASTGGKAPGLSRRLREWLEHAFAGDWQQRLDDLGKARTEWRAEGVPASEVSRRTNEYIAERGWLT